MYVDANRIRFRDKCSGDRHHDRQFVAESLLSVLLAYASLPILPFAHLCWCFGLSSLSVHRDLRTVLLLLCGVQKCHGFAPLLVHILAFAPKDC